MHERTRTLDGDGLHLDAVVPRLQRAVCRQQHDAPALRPGRGQLPAEAHPVHARQRLVVLAPHTHVEHGPTVVHPGAAVLDVQVQDQRVAPRLGPAERGLRSRGLVLDHGPYLSAHAALGLLEGLQPQGLARQAQGRLDAHGLEAREQRDRRCRRVRRRERGQQHDASQRRAPVAGTAPAGACAKRSRAATQERAAAATQETGGDKTGLHRPIVRTPAKAALARPQRPPTSFRAPSGGRLPCRPAPARA